jgi:hypothetical protein
VSRFPKLADLTAESSVVSSDAEANLIKRLRKSHRSLELHAKYGADEFKEFSLADSAVGLLAPTTFKFEEMQNLPIYLRHPEIALISYRGTIRAYPDDMNLKDLADFNHELLSQFGELGEIREFDLHGRKAIRFEGPQKANGADTWQMKIYADLGGKSFQLTALCPRLSRDLWKPVFEKSVMALRLGGASARGK